MKLFSTLLIGLLSFAFMSCGSGSRTVAIEEGWDLLNESRVNFVRDKDEIEVNNTNRLTAIRFRVEERDIRLSGLKIQFDNGDRLEPQIDETIAAGQSSKIIELGAEGRVIRKIEFSYRTTGSVLKGRARVLIFGRRAGWY